MNLKTRECMECSSRGDRVTTDTCKTYSESDTSQEVSCTEQSGLKIGRKFLHLNNTYNTRCITKSDQTWASNEEQLCTSKITYTGKKVK